MSQETYEVYVSEDALLEVHHGEQMTVARSFGRDWDAPPFIKLHEPALRGVAENLTATTPTVAVSFQEPRKTGWLFPIVMAAFAALAAWLIVRLP